MSKIDRSYHLFEDGKLELPFELGSIKKTLLDERLIEEIIKDEKVDFEGKEGSPWRVNFETNRVTQVWFNRDSKLRLGGRNICGEAQEVVEPLLDDNFQNLNHEIETVEQMKSSGKTIIYVVYRDYFGTLIGIVKN